MRTEENPWKRVLMVCIIYWFDAALGTLDSRNLNPNVTALCIKRRRLKFGRIFLSRRFTIFFLNLAVLVFFNRYFPSSRRESQIRGCIRGALLISIPVSVLDDVRFVIHALSRMISLGQQIMGSGPFADTTSSLQTVLAC